VDAWPSLPDGIRRQILAIVYLHRPAGGL
jgi:hypothetical protein